MDSRRVPALALFVLLLLPGPAAALAAAGDALPGAPAGEEPGAATAPGPKGTFTLDADFDQGTYDRVGHPVPHQLQLTNRTAFNFIWISVSSKGTAVLVDTTTGAVLGEYWTSPNGTARNPSRTTVDRNGNVWLTNRDEASSVGGVTKGSVLHIGNRMLGQCVDRNGNGAIDTSTGLNNVRGWDNAGAADTAGGVSTAKDECILHYVRTTSTNNRHVSVTQANDVWVSGTGRRDFNLLSGATGAILRVEPSIGCGGYGGLIDNQGVIWSTTAGLLLRWDTAMPLSAGKCISTNNAYGLCRDSVGNVWSSTTTSTLLKFSPGGALLATYANPVGFGLTQGCVIDGRDHVWVANGINGPNSVSHFLPTGTFLGAVAVSGPPTGVAVDGKGNVWSTDYSSQRASRINPDLGPVVNGHRVGQSDLTTVPLGGLLYNYSDMTGSLIPGLNERGTWTVLQDSTLPAARWGKVAWTGSVPAGATLEVRVASSPDGAAFSPWLPVANGQCFAVADGRYLRIEVEFRLNPAGQTPILYDLSAQARPVNLAEARAFTAGTSVPLTAGYATPGSVSRGTASAEGRVVGVAAPLPASAAALEETTAAAADCDAATARATTRVARVDLAGVVEAHGLVHEATATYAIGSLAGALGVTRVIERLVVQGQEVPLVPDAPQVFDLPGVGRLTVFEDATAPGPFGGVEYRGALLRLRLGPTGPLLPGAEDLVIGEVRVLAGLAVPPHAPVHDDANSGRDAGPGPAGAIAVGPAPAAFDGALGPGDTEDAYAFTVAAPLNRVAAALAVAHRASAVGGRVLVDASGPAVDAAPPATTVTAVPGDPEAQFTLTLRTAAGAIATATTTADGPPAAVDAVLAPGVYYVVVRVDAPEWLLTPHYAVAIGAAPPA